MQNQVQNRVVLAYLATEQGKILPKLKNSNGLNGCRRNW